MLHLSSTVILVLTLSTTLAGSAFAQRGDATTTGTSRAFNPAISLNALMLGHYLDGPAAEIHPGHDHSHGGPLEEGISIQELELQFSADVDAYARLNSTFAFHPGGEIDVEEAFADILTMPLGLGLRVGKFFMPFSRESALHTHQLPFVQRSLVLSTIFAEGWTSPGAQLSWLPGLPFYAEFRAAVADATNQEWFGNAENSGIAGLGQVMTMFELGESTTFGLQGGASIGENSFSDDTKLATAGVDLRWKPTRRTIYRGLRLNAEYTWAERDGVPADEPEELETLSGWTAFGQYQFARRWWVGGRYDWLDPRDHDTSNRWGASVSFVPSGFQALRLECSSTDDGQDISNSVYLQYNITIGSHPAHLY